MLIENSIDVDDRFIGFEHASLVMAVKAENKTELNDR